MKKLISNSKFLPYFITQFCGALNDNLFKNGMVTLIVFNLLVNNRQVEFTVLLAGAVFSLPFFLFSAHAGQIADKFEKHRCIRLLKSLELIIAALAMSSLVWHSLILMFIVLFLFALQSTYYGPIKYAILPECLLKSELIQANSLVESGTFIAILLGTLLGAYFIGFHQGEFWVGLGCILVSLVGATASFFIPKLQAADNNIVINYNVFTTTREVIKYAKINSRVWHSVLGVSWFWFVGSTLLVQLPVYVQQVLFGDQSVFILLLILIIAAIAGGCLLCNNLLKTEVDGRYSSLSLLIVAYCMVDLGNITPYHAAGVYTSIDILYLPWFQRCALDLTMTSLMLGILVVPLFAIIQSESPAEFRSRIIAGNNILNSLFMILSPLLAMFVMSQGYSLVDVFVINGWLNLPVACLVIYLIPVKTFKLILRFLMRLLFRVKVEGIEHLIGMKEPVVVFANHVSFLDVPLLAAFLPGEYCFAVNTQIAKKWWVKLPAKIVNTFVLDPNNPMQTRNLIKEIKAGSSCIIFPEGRLTTTGRLMKMYDGGMMIANHAQAKICCVWIEGVQYSVFTRLKNKVRQQIFPKIVCTIHPLQKVKIPADIRGRARRQLAGKLLQDIMANVMQKSAKVYPNIWQAIIAASHLVSKDKVIVEDVLFQSFTYNKLLLSSLTLAKCLQQIMPEKNTVGFLLPNMATSIVVLLAGFANGRVWAMLNYSGGIKAIKSACFTAKVSQVVTSRAFLDRLRLVGLVAELAADGVSVIYIEDVKIKIKWWHKANAYFELKLAWFSGSKGQETADKAAVVLFTSGSEGEPKGVVLSHENLQVNCNQVDSVLDLNQQDKLFNVLPMFHAFGLTIATLMPLLRGISQFSYLSPLHYKKIPGWIYETSATLLIGTDTFLFNYQKFAHEYDFQTVRYVFAGAEKLQDHTQKAWLDKFGIRILEGYGATETGPALAINTALFHEAGSVGKLLPGVECKLENIESVGDILWVRGKNNMLGYMLAENPGELKPLPNGWYNTGDIVSFTADNFLKIIGRYKRFAKIAGEMVSLAAVEQYVLQAFPDFESAVVAVPDLKKGERLILFISNKQITLSELRKYWQQEKLAELSLPKTITLVESLPRLATGKINYSELQIKAT